MQEYFDPYSQWLDFEDGHQPTNYYELLGLTLFESDGAAISHAADTRTARLRAVRPGEHLPQWSQLLDQLRQAKTCLLDPSAKATYDNGLRAAAGPSQAAQPQPAPATGTPSAQTPRIASPWDMPVQTPTQPTTPQNITPGQPVDPMTPMGMAPLQPRQPMGMTPQQPQQPLDPMTPMGMTPQQPLDPMAPMGMAPQQPLDPMAPMGMAPQQPQQPLDPMMPMGMAPMGMAVPVGMGSEPPAALPVGATGYQPAGVVGAEPLVRSDPPSMAGRAGGTEKSGTPWFAIRLLVLLIALLVVAFIYVLRKGGQQPDQEAASADQAATEERLPDNLPPQPSGPPKPPPVKSPSSKPPLAKPDKPTPTTPPELPKPNQPKPPEPKPDRPKPEPPKSEPKPEPPKPEPPPDPKRAAATKNAFAAARAAMADRDLETAQQELDRAASNVQTEADRAELKRLELLLGHLVEFWRLMRKCVAQLDGGEEIEIKETRIAVVEASEDQIIVKASGQLRRYSVIDMPTLLVTTLADKSLGRDASSQVLLGSFLAVDPKGDRARARYLWQKGVKAGLDVEQLMPELDANKP